MHLRERIYKLVTEFYDMKLIFIYFHDYKSAVETDKKRSPR